MSQLPIGTIVQLKKSDVKLMIFGKCQQRLKDGLVYDYIACVYPEGYQSSHANVFFNQEHIENVLKMGQIQQTTIYSNYRVGR